MPRAKPKFPYLLAWITVCVLGVSAFASFTAWSDSFSYAAIRDHWTEAIAQITNTQRHTNPTSHAIALSCHDNAGFERRYRLTHISEGIWNRVAVRAKLVAHQITIRYLEDEPSARPVIAEDFQEREFSDVVGIVFGVVTGMIGLWLAIATVLRARRAWFFGSGQDTST